MTAVKRSPSDGRPANLGYFGGFAKVAVSGSTRPYNALSFGPRIASGVSSAIRTEVRRGFCDGILRDVVRDSLRALTRSPWAHLRYGD